MLQNDVELYIIYIKKKSPKPNTYKTPYNTHKHTQEIN